MGERYRWNGELLSLQALDASAERLRATFDPGSASFNYQIHARIIRHFLGDEWFRQNVSLTASPKSFLRPDFVADMPDPHYSAYMLRLAELLINLQAVRGFSHCLDHMATRQIQAGLAEMQIGQLLYACDIPFRYLASGDVKSPDIAFQLPSGAEVFAEVKCKLDGAAYSDKALRNLSEKARKQIGSGNEGAVFVKVPLSWVDITKTNQGGPPKITLPDQLVHAARHELSGSSRIRKMIFFVFYHAVEPDGSLAITQVTMEVTSPSLEVSSPWRAELLGPEVPGRWVSMMDLAARWR